MTDTDQAAASFASLTQPRRVAVVGANDNLNAFTGGTIHNLVRHGFEGDIYPVNPRREVVQGLPAFPDLDALPTDIDTAVIVVRSDRVLDALDGCQRRGATSAIVIASGFGEGAAGKDGMRMRAELDDWIAANPMMILGPSTTGLVHLNGAYVPRAVTNQLPPERVRTGPVALISQSGASNNIIYNRAQASGLGVGLAIATGVQAGLTTWQAADHALDDDRIEAIALVLEQLGHPQEWLPVCERAEQLGKPLVVAKVGRTATGGAAISTHTGSLAGAWTAQSAALRDAGVYLASDLDELWELTSLVSRFGHSPADRPARLGVVAFSGGEGALIADLAEDAGLELPEVSENFTKLVDDRFSFVGAANPFDPTGEIIGREDDAAAVLRGFFDEHDYDAWLVAFNAQGGGRNSPTVQLLVDEIGDEGHPVALSWWSVAGMSDDFDARMAAYNGPTFAGSHRAVASFASWSRRRSFVPSTDIDSAPAPPLDGTYADARAFLGRLGVPFAEHAVVTSVNDAIAAADRLGYPIVAKSNVVSTEHKAAAGGVRVGLHDATAVAEAARELLDSSSEIVIEPQSSAGAELIVGAVHDEQAGPVIVIGTGGSLTEALDDVALVPVRTASADEIRRALAHSAAGAKVLQHDDAVDAAVATAQVVGALATAGYSAEVNPLILNGSRLVAVDARIENVNNPNEVQGAH